MKHNVLLLAGSVLLVSVLIGCTVGNVSQRNETRDEARDAAIKRLPDAPTSWQAVQQSVGVTRVGWIDQFGDATLNTLVREAQEKNLDLQAASASVDRARALARQAGAALSPQVGLGTGAGGRGNLDNVSDGNYSLSLDASWELDVWGRLRSGRQAALENAAAAEADYTYAQHSLAASVARAYFVSIEAKRQTELAQNIVDALKRTQRIVQLQFDNGAATQQDLSLIRSDVASAKESLARAGGSQRDAVRALELLLGRYPGAQLSVTRTLPAVPAPPPTGIPSALLERRPDLVAAERRIAASMSSVNQAKAAKLPQISLTGSLGGASTGLSNLLNPANLAWQAATSLLQPLIDGGARDAQVDVANAEQEAAIAQYAQAALTALGEVESTLDQGQVLRQRNQALRASVTDAQRALSIAQLRFQEGESDLLDVLSIQQRVFGAQSSTIAVERALLDQFIALNLALGGSWQ